jgi:exopolyphosphatase/guanosine-5'-triphosphate,3'-diphosphate pyrophosphatase
MTLALRYEAELEAPFLAAARMLLDPAGAHRAVVLGTALRLAYTLSAGTPDLLAGTALDRAGGRLVLRLAEGGGVFAGESVMRRLDRLAEVAGLVPETELAAA